MKIYPGRNGGTSPFGCCRARRAYALSGWVNADGSLDEGRYHDLGALKLDCDVGDRTGWFDIKPLGDAAPGLLVTIQGYAGDKAPAGRQWHSAGEFTVIKSLNAFYQIDTWKGMNASPVFSAEDNAIVAVHTSGSGGEEPWGSNNGATRLTLERLRIISSWADE